MVEERAVVVVVVGAFLGRTGAKAVASQRFAVKANTASTVEAIFILLDVFRVKK